MTQNNNKEHFFDSEEMEYWLTQYFLDPLTNYLDETIFRIDLYDSESSFIVEAFLPNTKKEDIDISVQSNTLQIKIKQFDPGHRKSIIKSRTVTFPIQISQLKMRTHFEHDILEIIFYKINQK